MTEPHLALRTYPNAEEACLAVGEEIAAAVRKHPEGIVLGLATGDTQIPVYTELVRQHEENELSFANVTTFSLDEFWALAPREGLSFRSYMHENLFDHVDLDPERRHLFDGTIQRDDIGAHCAEYEKMITDAGGIDLLLLGIGSNGHLAFNEPGAPVRGRARMVDLHHSTREAARLRGRSIPSNALTVGLATIIEARSIILLATGEMKSEAIRRVFDEPMTEAVPASILREHPSCRVHLDPAAAALLDPDVVAGS